MREAYFLNILAFLPILDEDEACGRVEAQPPLFSWCDQPMFESHRDRADGSVSAHGQATRCLDEENTDVAIVPCGWIQDRARHHVMASGFEHQAPADPVMLLQKLCPPLHHRRACQERPSSCHQPNRITASVSVEAEEGVARHLSEPLWREGIERYRRAAAQYEVADECAGSSRLCQPEMSVPEGIEDRCRR